MHIYITIIYTNTHTHTYIYTYIYTHTHTYIHTYQHYFEGLLEIVLGIVLYLHYSMRSAKPSVDRMYSTVALSKVTKIIATKEWSIINVISTSRSFSHKCWSFR